MSNITDNVYVKGSKPSVVIGESGKQINPDLFLLANAKFVASIHAKGMKMRGIKFRNIKEKFSLKSTNWKQAEKELEEIIDRFKLLELTTTNN